MNAPEKIQPDCREDLCLENVRVRISKSGNLPERPFCEAWIFIGKEKFYTSSFSKMTRDNTDHERLLGIGIRITEETTADKFLSSQDEDMKTLRDEFIRYFL